MKRDLDLVRTILIEIETVPDGRPKTFDASKIGIIKFRHVELLKMAGFLNSDGFNETTSKLKVQLTWEGHDFLESVQDQGVWDQTKKAVVETGGSAALEIVKALAIGFAKTKISKHTGIPM